MTAYVFIKLVQKFVELLLPDNICIIVSDLLEEMNINLFFHKPSLILTNIIFFSQINKPVEQTSISDDCTLFDFSSIFQSFSQ